MNLKAAALRLTGLGWYVAACIVTGVVGGIFLDKLLGVAPLFTLLGVLLGTVAAFYGLYKMVQPLMSGNTPKPKPGAGSPQDQSAQNQCSQDQERGNDGGNT